MKAEKNNRNHFRSLKTVVNNYTKKERLSNMFKNIINFINVSTTIMHFNETVI